MIKHKVVEDLLEMVATVVETAETSEEVDEDFVMIRELAEQLYEELQNLDEE